MEAEHYDAIARAVNARRLESRNVARRKVIELTADMADVFAQADPQFMITNFYRACGLTGDDIAMAQAREAVL